MKKKKIKNPLIRRIPRELLGDWKKYLVVALFLILTIGFVSGMYVANESMLVAANEGVTKYKLEDGHFELDKKADETLLSAIETGTKADVKQYYLDKAKKELDEKLDEKAYPEAYDKAWDKIVEEIDDKYADAEEKYELNDPDFTEVPVKVYENFFRNEEEDYNNDGEAEGNIRVYAKNDNVDLACLLDGAFPEKADEIAIDRMHADNVGVKVGDEISVSGQRFKVVGLIAYVNYATLHEKSTDMMFDAIKFGVSVVTPEEFESLNQEKLQYSYSWVYDKAPKNEKQEKKMSEDLMEALGEEVTLESFVPQYLNQAITFTGDDMGSDRAMIIMLLYMIIVIMAFVFGITISNTIRKEAGVIGTLRASGYTRKELIGHYMALPVIVTLIGAVIGNILGYTALKKVCAGMYYGSYSLPTYVTAWNADAFWMTTVVPVLIMLVVNYGILRYKLRLSPLKFLRRDLSGSRRKRAVRLSPKLGIFHRFRLRVIFQNMSNYIVLFIGIIFANLLLFFGLLLPSVLSHYQQDIQSNMLAKYQYMLEVPVSAMSGNKLDSMLELLQFSYGTKTENEDAEAFSAYSLETLPSKYKTDEVILYGIKPDSKYIDADLEDGDGVYISSAYAEKFLLKPGDSITLKEKYEKTKYTFKVKGIYKYSGGICVFMPQEKLNDTFDLGNDYFSGYFSNSKIKDIDEKYIGSVLDLEALTKISRQLDVSMGNMMGMVNAFAIGIYMVVIYLLSKIIIEKNAQAISMTKILGYTNGEISRLYIWSTTIVVIICLLLSLPIEKAVMNVLFREMMLTSITGWITFYIDPKIFVEMFVIGVAAYAIVAAIEYRRIRKVPMDEALKNVE